MRLLVALIAWLGAVAGAAAISSAVASSIHNSPSSGQPGGAGTVSSSYDASNVKSTDSDSLWKEPNLAKALAAATRALGADAQIDNAVI